MRFIKVEHCLGNGFESLPNSIVIPVCLDYNVLECSVQFVKCWKCLMKVWFHSSFHPVVSTGWQSSWSLQMKWECITWLASKLYTPLGKQHLLTQKHKLTWTHLTHSIHLRVSSEKCFENLFERSCHNICCSDYDPGWWQQETWRMGRSLQDRQRRESQESC